MLNIAIDGPAGAGKSTISKKVAEKLNITYLDTGAMYRTVGLFMLQNNVSYLDEQQVNKFLDKVTIEFKGSSLDKHIYLNGEDVSSLIRTSKISKAASDYSKLQCVREKLVNMQRDIAKTQDIVLDGRDISSNVLPNTINKFYLTASSEVRAKRRYDEQILKGDKVTFEEVLKDVIDRDYNDMNRKIAPLVKTADAIEIDSTDLTIEQVVDKIISLVKRG